MERRGDATRLCRHEPLLSTRSNRWDPAAAVKASRTKRTCTVLPRVQAPGVLTLGSRGNPTHVEHCRQRHTETLVNAFTAALTRNSYYYENDFVNVRPPAKVRDRTHQDHKSNCLPRVSAPSTRSLICRILWPTS